jgi:hypothetical protein
VDDVSKVICGVGSGDADGSNVLGGCAVGSSWDGGVIPVVVITGGIVDCEDAVVDGVLETDKREIFWNVLPGAALRRNTDPMLRFITFDICPKKETCRPVVCMLVVLVRRGVENACEHTSPSLLLLY